MPGRRWRGLSYANVMATIAVFIALGGVGYATVAVPPNSVGTQQLRDGAVIGSKVKDRSLTRADIDVSKLGIVPAATHAASASRASLASSLVAPEGFHDVGTSGNPVFATGCQNRGAPTGDVAFYKDREGVVHLKGVVVGCSTYNVFALPDGYRPAPGVSVQLPNNVTVDGAGVTPGYDGMVSCTTHSVGDACSLDGIAFRAGS